MLLERVEDGVDGFAALLALGVGLAATFDPGEVFDFLEEVGEDFGWVELFEVDLVFCAGDEGDESLDGVACFCAESGGEEWIAECLPNRLAFFS